MWAETPARRCASAMSLLGAGRVLLEPRTADRPRDASRCCAECVSEGWLRARAVVAAASLVALSAAVVVCCFRVLVPARCPSDPSHSFTARNHPPQSVLSSLLSRSRSSTCARLNQHARRPRPRLAFGARDPRRRPDRFAARLWPLLLLDDRPLDGRSHPRCVPPVATFPTRRAASSPRAAPD